VVCLVSGIEFCTPRNANIVGHLWRLISALQMWSELDEADLGVRVALGSLDRRF
jgi:hypothetical protein